MASRSSAPIHRCRTASGTVEPHAATTVAASAASRRRLPRRPSCPPCRARPGWMSTGTHDVSRRGAVRGTRRRARPGRGATAGAPCSTSSRTRSISPATRFARPRPLAAMPAPAATVTGTYEQDQLGRGRHVTDTGGRRGRHRGPGCAADPTLAPAVGGDAHDAGRRRCRERRRRCAGGHRGSPRRSRAAGCGTSSRRHRAGASRCRGHRGSGRGGGGAHRRTKGRAGPARRRHRRAAPP